MKANSHQLKRRLFQRFFFVYSCIWMDLSCTHHDINKLKLVSFYYLLLFTQKSFFCYCGGLPWCVRFDFFAFYKCKYKVFFQFHFSCSIVKFYWFTILNKPTSAIWFNASLLALTRSINFFLTLIRVFFFNQLISIIPFSIAIYVLFNVLQYTHNLPVCTQQHRCYV